MLRSARLLIPLALYALGCSKVVAEAQAEEPPSKPKTAAAAKGNGKDHDAKDGKEVDSDARYGVPFAWEVSKDEPLARARAYLTETLADNATNAGQGKAHFAPFAEKQSPRATVVTCSDSRVQSDAWDATPENDAFTVRNIGNQITRAHGSVEYGLEHLSTPVLLVLGHTGCGAVKAAMGPLDGLSEPLRAELKDLKLPPPQKGVPERKAWSEAVIANVNHQVAFAVAHFGTLLREQRVLVVGGVYDLRNDLGKGFGRVSIVNVNGNTDADRLKAFQAALTPGASGLDTPLLGGRPPRRKSAEENLVDLLNDQHGPKPRLGLQAVAKPAAESH